MSDLLIILKPDAQTLVAFDKYCRTRKINRQQALLDFMVRSGKRPRKKLPALRDRTGNDKT